MRRGPLIVLLFVFGPALSGCASIPEAPAPVIVSAVPEMTASDPVVPWFYPGNRVEWAEAPLPMLPLDVFVSPRRPRQASAVAIRVQEPPGPPLENATASLAGFEVRLVRDGTGWVGVAPLPLDSAGVFTLEVTGVRAGAPVVEQRAVWVDERVYPSTRISISAGAASDPEVDARIARERELIGSSLRSSGDVWLPADTFDWPRPLVRTSPFGERRVFNGSVRSRHLGLDIRGRQGQPTHAAAGGRVLLTGRFYYQGNAVYLDHGLGVVTAYFHLSSIVVEKGDLVEVGQLLGRVGSTGRSTAPHLHWAAYVDGVNVDPESLIGFKPIPRRATTDHEDELVRPNY